MRPIGEVRLAMKQAWAQGPAPVTEAAARACVGLGAARYTASRMVEAGDLVVIQPGRPAVLGLPMAGQGASSPDDVVSVVHALDLLTRSFWERGE